MGRGGGKGRVWKTKEGIMKTSGIVDRGEDTIRNFEKVEQKGALTPPYLGKVYFRSRLRGKGWSIPKFSERSGTLSTVQFIMGNSQPPIFPSSFLQSLPNLSTTSQTEMTKNARLQYRVIVLRDCKEHYQGKCLIIDKNRNKPFKNVNKYRQRVTAPQRK